MWYVFNATDADNSLDNRIKYRPEHLARLNKLINEGRLLLAGAYPAIDNIDPGENGFNGSLIVAEFDSSIDIKPFKKSLP
jgi:uncharacterized protein YciI